MEKRRIYLKLMLILTLCIAVVSCEDNKDEPVSPEIITAFYEYDTVPEEVMNAPEKYGFVKQNCWQLDKNISLEVDICYWNEEFKVFIFKGESTQFVGSEVKQTGNLKLSDFTWYLNESIHKHVNSNDFIIGNLPLYVFNNEEPVTAQVMENPEKYGFSAIECWYQKLIFQPEEKEETGTIKIWSNQNGLFCSGGEFWNNKFYLWNNNGDLFYSENGIYEIREGQKYRVLGSMNGNPYQIRILNGDSPKFSRVHLLAKNIEFGYLESSYSSFLGYACSGSIFFDVYDYIDLTDISVSYESSWVQTANTRIAYKKGESYAAGKYYNCTRIAVDLATSRNYGNLRYTTCTIDLKNVCGEDYTLYVSVSQKGQSDGGGSGGDSETLGPEWEQFEASGYMPYWYCPGTGEKIPSMPSKTTVAAYRNKSTGAYKVRWADKYYNASKGYNKIALEKEYHSIYKNGHWLSCLDYFYLEVTI